MNLQQSGVAENQLLDNPQEMQDQEVPQLVPDIQSSTPNASLPDVIPVSSDTGLTLHPAASTGPPARAQTVRRTISQLSPIFVDHNSNPEARHPRRVMYAGIAIHRNLALAGGGVQIHPIAIEAPDFIFGQYEEVPDTDRVVRRRQLRNITPNGQNAGATPAGSDDPSQNAQEPTRRARRRTRQLEESQN